MSKDSFHSVLENLFIKSAKEDWEKIAADEIKKENPLESLRWRGKDEIFFLPYYDAGDSAQQQFPNRFVPPAGVNASSSKRAWANLPAVAVSNEMTANESALRHLAAGADGVFFDLRNLRRPDFQRLLHGIPWQHCTLAFHAGTGDALQETLVSYLKQQVAPQAITGALFWDDVPKKTTTHTGFAAAAPNLKTLGLAIPPAPPTEEISEALVRGIQTAEAFADAAGLKEIFRSICFSLVTDAVLAESSSKLRALRMVWYQVAHAYGHDDFKVSDVLIHARAPRVTDDAYAPHENMLRGTFAAIGAIAGGCDMLTVESDDAPAAVPRQARNISTILREESFFDRVSDPFAGSYAFDAITRDIAEKAWSAFQQKVQRL